MNFSDDELAKMVPEFLEMTPGQKVKIRALLADTPKRGGMIPLGALAPELVLEETMIMALKGHESVPDGKYALVELYCSDYNCDCRRVIIQVREETAPGRICATFNFGWESKAFYRRWSGGSEFAQEMAGGVIENLGENGPHAEVLFQAFVNLGLKNSAYVDRLKRHYKLFRSLLEKEKPLRRRWSLPGRPGGGRRKRLK